MNKPQETPMTTSRTLLEQLVAFDTTSRESNLALIDFVRRYLTDLGVSCELIYNAERSKANLYGRLGPAGKGGVMLSGHSDVVPVDGQTWSVPPFALTERDGKLYGRGTADMKGFIACMLAAVPNFLAQPLVVMSAGHVRQIGSPDEIYRRPLDPFVAGFVGDVNVLPGRYAGRDNGVVVALGGNMLRIPAERVQASVGDRLDVYVRPENIQLGPLGPRSFLSATVITHVFQGDHVDVHLDVPALGSATLFARQSGLDSLTRWPVGSPVGVTFDDDGVCAFTTANQG